MFTQVLQLIRSFTGAQGIIYPQISSGKTQLHSSLCATDKGSAECDQHTRQAETEIRFP